MQRDDKGNSTSEAAVSPANLDASANITRLAAQISGSATAKTIFGDPVRHGQNVIVPVAKATWGLGGGKSKAAGDEGYGGGAHIVPVGYIEINDARVRFRRLRYSPWLIAAAALLTGAAFAAGNQLAGKRQDNAVRRAR